MKKKKAAAKQRTKPGRPTHAAVKTRRRALVVALADAALKARAGSKALAKRLGVSQATLRLDLAALVEDSRVLDSAVTAAPDSLIELYRSSDTCEDALKADRALLDASLTGALERMSVETVLAVSKEVRMKLAARDEERSRVDSRKPVEVRVVWMSDWREKVKSNEAADRADATLAGSEP